MEVLAINDRDLHLGPSQSLSGIQTAESCTDNDNPRSAIHLAAPCPTSIRFTRWPMVPEVLRAQTKQHPSLHGFAGECLRPLTWSLWHCFVLFC